MMMMMVMMQQVLDAAHAPLVTLSPATAVRTPGRASAGPPTAGVHLLSALALPAPVCTRHPALHLAVQVANILQHLLIAAARLREAGQRAVVGQEAFTLLLHQLVFPLLSL